MQLVAGVCACAALAPALAQSPPVSSIRVTGDAKVTARPDRVQIDIGVTTHAVTSQEVQVTLDDLGKIGSCIDGATQAGANRVQGIQFTLRDQDAVRAQALREAAGRARAEADVLAAALGLRVVRILTVEENSPRVMPVRMYGDARTMATANAAPATPVEGGTLEVTADVTLSVEVSPAGR